MNTQMLKATFMVALFSVFSGFAMEEPASKKQKQDIMKEPKEWHFIVGNKNETTIPVMISIEGDNSPLFPNNKELVDMGRSSQLTDMYALKHMDGRSLGTIKFLTDAGKANLQVMFNVGSLSRIYDFDIAEAKDNIYAFTVLKDDTAKPAGNFENSTFALVANGTNILSEKEKVERGRLLKRSEIKHILDEKKLEKLLPMLPRK